MATHRITQADIKDWAKNYKGPLFDGILCDPPYELGFMGKSWDSSGIAFDVDMWKDLLRILKPGGHLLAFSGSRTYHRMAVAIEDAGFEIRDMIEWVYGSGFPKSLNIGKAVDKIAERADMFAPFAEHYEAQRKAKGLTHNQICEAGKFYNNHNHGGASSNWAIGANVPTLEQWGVLQPLLDLSNEFKPLIERIERERELIGKQKALDGFIFDGIDGKQIGTKEIDITKGTSEWEGWGTALKPSHEPICMARKPLGEKTVAENCLKYGTGGINIDESRVENTGKSTLRPLGKSAYQKGGGIVNGGVAGTHEVESEFGGGHDGGRFPANLIHDGSDEVEAVFPQTAKAGSYKGEGSKSGGIWSESTGKPAGMEYGDSGSASRFFYTAKASRAERSKGLDSTVSIRVQLEICENNITRQENLAQLQVVMDNSHLKATAESGIGTKSGTEWSMSLFGNQYTEKYPINTKSTTKTTTSSTTTSVILNWLTGLLTNESTLGVNLEMASGGNPVKSAESSNTLIATINDQTALALGVNPAQANKRLLISVSDGKNFHSTVKPLSLTKYLATLIKPPTGGRLLVPFSGSGSEMIGALQAGWGYVEGVELTEEYIPIAEARIKYWLEQVEEEDKQGKLL